MNGLHSTVLRIKVFVVTLFMLLGISALSVAAEPSTDNEHDAHHNQRFNPGTFITHHIADEHGWHIFKFRDFDVTLPLPIILWTENEGLVCFLSSKFAGDDHGPKLYNGYVYDHGHITAENGSAVYDFSITKNVFAIFISLILICWLMISIARTYTRNPDSAPTGIQNVIEVFIMFLRDEVAIPAIGEKKYLKFFPYILTLFFFIFINNLMGLIPLFPGGANVTGNISVTLALAFFTFLMVKINGNKNYWMHIFNTPGVPWWLKFPIPLMPIVELLGVITKPFVLMIRLFANITAGHIIILGFFSLIFIFGEISAAIGYGVSVFSLAFSIFISLLELLVAFIQAYVFALLSALYIGMAVEDHHHEHDHGVAKSH